MILLRLLALAGILSLTSCGTASHYAGQLLGTAGGLLGPVTGLLRLQEGGSEKAWQQKAEREKSILQKKSAHDRSPAPDQRPQ